MVMCGWCSPVSIFHVIWFIRVWNVLEEFEGKYDYWFTISLISCSESFTFYQISRFWFIIKDWILCNHVLITLRLGNNMLSWKESCDITCNTICSFWFLFISHIDVESPGFRFDQQEICDQFIREVAGFNEDTLAFILFLLNFSKFDAKISLRLVTQHCCGFKNDIPLSHSEVSSGNKACET